MVQPWRKPNSNRRRPLKLRSKKEASLAAVPKNWNCHHVSKWQAGTVTGAVSLEYKISGAALKCQSRKDYRGHAVEYALLFWTLIRA